MKERYDKSTISEQVIKSIKDAQASTEELPIDAITLQTEYSLAEVIDKAHVDLEDTDLVIVLSGRSSFQGDYIEAGDKFALCENEYDSTDTLRRMLYGISIAKECTIKNFTNGIFKPVYVYFNGVASQNEELRNILRRDHAFDGYPANLFIIDSTPFDNTLGQVIGLSRFLELYWPSYSQRMGISRPPNLVFGTSSYHVTRVKQAVGENSPLLTAQFWHQKPELFNKLPPAMRAYVLNPGEILKRASIKVLGCDRQITSNPHWEKDLRGDMEARVNYSCIQFPASIACKLPGNDRTVHSAIEKSSLRQIKNNLFFTPLCEEDRKAVGSSEAKSVKMLQ